MTVLRVLIISTKNIRHIKGASSTGYYTQVNCAGMKKKTKTVDAANNIVWKEKFEFDLQGTSENERLIFIVKRASLLPLSKKNRVAGWNEITCKSAFAHASGHSQECELNLLDRNNKSTYATLQLKFQIVEEIGPSSPPEEKSMKDGGYFIIDVYRAEGLPRMDIGHISDCQKGHHDLVDCYFVASYADEQATTSVIKQSANPIWNERLYLPFDLPLKSDNITFEMKDQDIFTRDDLIATAVLSTLDMTANGYEGCLPCFGPAFINFYGSQRKFHLTDTKRMHEMNSGKIDGCAFRGRVLLQIRTQLGKVPTNMREVIPSEDMTRSEFLSNKAKFFIRATFSDCFLLRTKDITTIEVSFGLFGDSETDDNQFSRPSCVHPFLPSVSYHPIQQYHAPWWPHDKPCIVYEVDMQRSTHRIELNNYFNYLVQELKRFTENFQSVEQESGRETTEEFVRHFTNLCQRLLEWPMDSDLQTELDVQIWQMKINRLQDIITNVYHILKSYKHPEIGAHDSKWRQQILTEIQSIRDKLLHLQDVCPQNEFPDVFIWLYNNWHKVAYCRIPIKDILFSNTEECSGNLCNKISTWTFKFPHHSSTRECRNPGLVRVNLWFGPEEDFSSCLTTTLNSSASYITYAETYENEVKCCGTWRKGPAVLRWTNALGQKYFKRTNYPLIPQWKFFGEWFLDNTQDFQSESDNPTTDASQDNANNRPLKSSTPETKPITGNDETINLESNTNNTTAMTTKNGIIRDNEAKPEKLEWANESPTDTKFRKHNWQQDPLGEYQSGFLTVRRHKWRRKMIPEAELKGPPQSTMKLKHKSHTFVFSSPSYYLTYSEAHLYELKIFVYQARNLLAGDKSGFSDPFVRVTFLSHILESRCIAKTLCPLWDQTLVIRNILLPGQPEYCYTNLAEIVAELYDHDKFGEDEYLGEARFVPKVGPRHNISTDLLSWAPITIGSESAGEILIGGEIFLLDNGDSIPLDETQESNQLSGIPTEIKPGMTKATIEILCIGLRSTNGWNKSLTCPFVEFLYENSTPIAVTNEILDFPGNTNFGTNVLKAELMLPEQDTFLLPLTIRLKNRGAFQRISIIGGGIISNIQQFCHPEFVPGTGDTADQSKLKITTNEAIIEMPESNCAATVTTNRTKFTKTRDKVTDDDMDLDWWSRYYASKGDKIKCGEYLRKGYRTIQIYNTELENYEPLKSTIHSIGTFAIYGGKQAPSIGSDTNSTFTRDKIADLKATFRIHRSKQQKTHSTVVAAMANRLKAVYPDLLMRIYFVRAYDLQAKDPGKQSDPYIKIQIGNNDVELTESLRNNSLNPIFGCVFESVITMPKDHHLVIKVLDKDLFSQDDLIGQTYINLEDRILAPCWATCGLSPQYLASGPYPWRDIKQPKAILEELCLLRGIPQPVYHIANHLQIGDQDHELSSFEQDNCSSQLPTGRPEERLALYVLHKLNLVVKEHVETRTLFHPSDPGKPQGRLEMWIDLFPLNETLVRPAAINISPREPKSYVLRCIIYNVHNVILQEKNLLGDEMSDVFIKAWMKGIEQEWQKTDVHHRCLHGEANFNYRLIFAFKFLQGEDVLVHQEKRLFYLHETAVAIRPTLCLQIYDYDLLSRDDSLGMLELELMEMIPPDKRLKDCTIEKYTQKLQPNSPRINLFKQKWIRGYWLCPATNGTKHRIGGKLEMELELLTEEAAKLKPAGFGRNEPNANPHLEPPSRPSSSLSWFTSPLKFLRYLLCTRFRTLFLVIIIVALVVLLLYASSTMFLDAAIHRMVNNL